MKAIKLISTLLAVLVLASAFTVLVSAADSDELKYETDTGNGKSLMIYDKDTDTYSYKTGMYLDEEGNVKVIETAEEKIALMDYRYGTDKFELYVDAYSGEVAIRSKSTSETLFTNPYNIGKSTATASDGSTKDELMSQLIVHYTDVASGSSGALYSYTWSAVRKQISVMNIKGGIRVEYAIGREESKSLLPRMIEASAMEEIFATIEANMEADISSGKIPADKAADERLRLDQFKAYYSEYSLKAAISQEMYDKYCKDFPILQKFEALAKDDPKYDGFTIYVLDEANMGEQLIKKQEALIKEYCEEYTFQDLDEDHAYVEYEANIENYPLFKMALEYTVEDSGLVVRLPANGIRFNEALYSLDSIEILPYMGAGMNPNEGYTFFPDGSGTIFDFQEIAILGTRQNFLGKVYGQDYAYHEPSGMHEEVIRYPVFGVYEKEQLTKTVIDSKGNENKIPYTKDRGYVAIVEEGDSLVEISSSHGGNVSEYNTIVLSVYPRPTDSYNMADVISVGTNTEWTVVSSRRYTGNYKVRYIMLTDNDVAATATAAGKTAERYYEPSYVGMATAYRDYLVKDLKSLSRLTKDDVGDDIPLYIESFGALETTEKFLSIPINVMTALTTFEDIQTMYDDLEGNGITNVNFIMKGFTKGGISSPQVPYNLKWENAVSKEMDFEELTEYAKNEGFGLFPDFDFVFSSSDRWFDGLDLKKHAAKTIDNRYTSKREYSATKHTYVSYFELVLSPAYFSHFYEKFIPKYEKYSPIGISLSTLGSYLNSDFDEDDPYHRADGQGYTEQAFDYIKTEFADNGTEIMTSGGNAYSWKYVDHITDIALDSSRFSISSASVPFLGMVLHGYVEIAGTPINKEGNLDYAFLKSIESGAALKFILSYRNTEKLKESEKLSQHYSVNYDIWYGDGTGDLVTMYKRLNAALNDVQTSIIIDHDFIDGTRVPDDDELLLDAEQAIEDAIAYEIALENATSEAERKAIYDARQLIVKYERRISEGDWYYGKQELNATSLALIDYNAKLAAANSALEAYLAAQQFHGMYKTHVTGYETMKIEDAITAYKTYIATKDDTTKTTDEKNAAEKAWTDWKDILDNDADATNGNPYAEKIEAFVAAETAYNANKNDASLKATYDAAVAALKNTVAGKSVNMTDAIAAMNALDPYKRTWINASAAGQKAAETAFKEKAKELYDDAGLYNGIVYSIMYGGEKVGGSQYNRDMIYAEAYKTATKNLDKSLDKLYTAYASLMDAQEYVKEVFNAEKLEKAWNTILSKDAYRAEEREALKQKYEALLAHFEAHKTEYEYLVNTDFAAIVAEHYEGYAKLIDSAKAASRSNNTVSGLKEYYIDKNLDTDYLKAGEFSWNEKIVENDDKVVVEKPVPNTKKYESDTNKIVHETFDNGKELLLNFNDYRVVVALNGTVYTIDAYGYVVIHGVNA